jgi:TetR/AcrR family transcriptional regulator, transcriptional repressor of bet genes
MARALPRYRRYTSEVRAQMLVEAGLVCLAQGGIRAFTVDNICKAAGASRGLITHHFGSKDQLLAAVYAAAYQPLLAVITPDDGPEPELPQLLDHLFSPANYTRESLSVWLALWGEVATNPALQEEHRALYSRYREVVSRSIAAFALARGRQVDAEQVAVSLIALADGLWLELCISPESLSRARARAACLSMLEPILGPIPEAEG